MRTRALVSLHRSTYISVLKALLFKFSKHIVDFLHDKTKMCNSLPSSIHGVQRRMISVDIFFVFLRLLFFALLLLYKT